MRKNNWEAVDKYLDKFVLDEDPILEQVLTANKDADLPPIDVTPTQGQFLTIICTITGAKSILEIGTLGGYSTICLARGVGADGKVVTLEKSPKHAEVASKNLEHAGLRDRVDIKIGSALESLMSIQQLSPKPTFDLFFIDADKENNPKYFDTALQLSHPGSVIIVDNVIREGSFLSDSNDPNDIGTKQLLETVRNYDNLKTTVIQTVGGKGWDGFLMATVY